VETRNTHPKFEGVLSAQHQEVCSNSVSSYYYFPYRNVKSDGCSFTAHAPNLRLLERAVNKMPEAGNAATPNYLPDRLCSPKLHPDLGISNFLLGLPPQVPNRCLLWGGRHLYVGINLHRAGNWTHHSLLYFLS
jgi:hypothetical protein